MGYPDGYLDGVGMTEDEVLQFCGDGIMVKVQARLLHAAVRGTQWPPRRLELEGPRVVARGSPDGAPEGGADGSTGAGEGLTTHGIGRRRLKVTGFDSRLVAKGWLKASVVKLIWSKLGELPDWSPGGWSGTGVRWDAHHVCGVEAGHRATQLVRHVLPYEEGTPAI